MVKHKTKAVRVVKTQEQVLTEIKRLVLNSVPSEDSKIAYGVGLSLFLTWYQEQGFTALNRAVVLEYKTMLEEREYSPATINLRLTPIKRLAQEMVFNGILDSAIGAGIQAIKGAKNSGVRTGNWLDKRTAGKVLNSTNPNTLKGFRDRAILAVALGSGLRRNEIKNLKVEDIQQRDGCWVLLDLKGKRNKVRTVPIDSWVWVAINAWLEKAGIETGLIFRSMRKGGSISNLGESMSSQAIHNVIHLYANIAPHDMRRTYAKLAHKGGCPIEQIQLSLGHDSIQTTERYLGIEQDFNSTPSKALGLKLDW